MVRFTWSRLVHGAFVSLGEQLARLRHEFRIGTAPRRNVRRRKFAARLVAAEVQLLEARVLLSALTDTTPVTTNNVTSGTSTGSVVLATFTELQQFISLDPPGEISTGTQVVGVSGNTVVGNYETAGFVNHGFLYNGSTYVSIDAPGATRTLVTGMSGSDVVGYFFDSNNHSHGFLFDGTNYTTIGPTGAENAAVFAISGNDFVGTFDAGGATHGFLYDGTSYSTIDPPGSEDTVPQGVFGNRIVGYYTGSDNNTHAFLFDGSTYTTIDAFGSAQIFATSVSASSVAGYYTDSGNANRGFVYDGPTTTQIGPLGATSSHVTAIEGNDLAGYYTSTGNHPHGFVFDGSTYTTIDAPNSSQTAIYAISSGEAGGFYVNSAGQHGFLDYTTEPAANFTPDVNWGGTLVGTPTVSVQMVSQTATGSTWEVLGTATYANSGNFTASVTVNDTLGNSVSTSNTSFVVGNAQSAPAFTSNPSAVFAAGLFGTFSVSASGTPGATLTESGTDTLPTGMNFDHNTGILSGTPATNSNGDYFLHFTASNGVAPDATQTFTLQVTSQFPFAGEYAVNAGGPLTLASIAQVGSALTLNGTSSTASATITDATHILVNGSDTATYGNSSITFSSGTFAGQVWTKLDLPVNYTNQGGAAVQVIQNGTSLTFVNKLGATSTGHWISPTQVMADDWGNEIGTIGNGTISWSVGVVWNESLALTGTNDGSGTTAISATPSPIFVADYVNPLGMAVHFVQTGTNNVVVIDATGHMALGSFINSTQFTTPYFPGQVATISGIGDTISWSGGTVWNRTNPTSAITVTNYTNPSGIPVHLIQNGTNQVAFVDALARISLGSISETTLTNDLFSGISGSLASNSINWSNGIVWTQMVSPLLLITRAADASGAVSHVGVQSATTLLGLDGTLQGVTGTRVNDEIEWSNGEVWANFDFDILNALFEMGSGFP